MTTPQRILIADNHQLFLDGLRMLLDRIDTCEVVGDAKNGREVLDFLAENQVDCVLIDVEMPELNGIEATQIIKRQWPDVRVLAISMMGDYTTVQQMLKAGADGYLLKDMGKAELVRALESVAVGRIFISPALSPVLVHGVAERPINRQAYAEPLTRREREIMLLILDGLTNEQMALKLCLSRTTIDTHRKHIMGKTGCKNSAALVRYALERNMQI
ncbi:response regulator [Fibrella aquatilis]|uniref:Response regulator transcription factor n=1 Tax=Fibrella aquatilis TaxID=2817059 RepID=A0A939K0H2_9BACT|nr:response regulator transcription factor [Fibrella aquatilis]MBO0932468.1 response regulator transcription factor [Fibrella aquatilis]